MKHFAFALVVFTSMQAAAQHGSLKGFRPPLDIPLNLSGNFGEFRTNHFHSGLDIKTQGREGLPVYAVTHGCVSRIKVSGYGFGNVVYIDHPNGYTTVYAHLSEFKEPIASYLRESQYELEEWEVDLYPGKNRLCVDSSAVIALSGNSGSSSGPHLHFEVRETESEHPVNPLLWNFPVADTRAPLVKGIQLTPLSDSSEISGTRRSQLFETMASTGKVALKRTSPIPVSGAFGVGVHTIDLLDNNSNSCGIYRIVVTVDGEEVYEQRIDRLDFGVKRYMNAHADYQLLKKEKKSIHRTFTLPDNRLPIYKTIRGNGALSVALGVSSTIAVEVFDVHGNASSVSFSVIGSPAKTKGDESQVLPEGARLFQYDTVNSIRTDSCDVFVPEGRLFDDALCWIEPVARRSTPYSSHYQIGNRYEPLNDNVLVAIRPSSIPEGKENKLLMVNYDPDRQRYRAVGGELINGEVSARIMEFGEFAVAIDDTPPAVSIVRFSRSYVECKVTDDLSGVDFIRAECDGQWIRMHYDPKRNLLWHNASDDGIITPQSKQFSIEVRDERGNVRTLSRSF
jgi:hypothetical protein